MTMLKIALPWIAGDRQADSRVADRIADARLQVRLSVRAIIRTTQTITVGSSPAYRCEASDGSGEIDLIFLGRDTIPGLRAGRRCVVEGMIGKHNGTLAVWNPRYQLLPADDDLTQW
jgi:RecG-like helicase